MICSNGQNSACFIDCSTESTTVPYRTTGRQALSKVAAGDYDFAAELCTYYLIIRRLSIYFKICNFNHLSLPQYPFFRPFSFNAKICDATKIIAKLQMEKLTFRSADNPVETGLGKNLVKKNDGRHVIVFTT